MSAKLNLLAFIGWPTRTEGSQRGPLPVIVITMIIRVIMMLEAKLGSHIDQQKLLGYVSLFPNRRQPAREIALRSGPLSPTVSSVIAKLDISF